MPLSINMGLPHKIGARKSVGSFPDIEICAPYF